MKTSSPAQVPTSHLIVKKLRLVASALQLAAIIYLTWILWLILAPLRAPETLTNWLKMAWQRSLSNLEPWQFGTYFLVDFINWCVIAGAVLYCWKAMQQLKQLDGHDAATSRHIVIGAWLATAAEVFAIFARPVKSYVMTCCDQTAAPTFHWFLGPQDMLIAMFCLTLLGLAYVFNWKADLADEMKGFI